MAEIEIIEQIDETIKVVIPKMYKVMLHNDDKTTFDFVIAVLVRIFHRSTEEAIAIAENIHNSGQGIAGSPYTREIAEEKVSETINYSRTHNFPLTATFEEI